MNNDLITNFEFLKNIDKNLYTIISEAEMLYRDEYFEQCMVQTRRFGEHLCKNILGSRKTSGKSFDEMLATLKDMGTGEEQEREFIKDLYFLKKHGNNSAHSAKVNKDGIEALECLQRAFETTINYCVYKTGANPRILKLRYDTELLITGKGTPKTLTKKYREQKTSKPETQKKKKNLQKQSYRMITKQNKNGIPAFWVFMGISSLISAALLLAVIILAK